MNTKLTINLSEGVLNVEGSEEFVRTVYQDFKGEVAKRIPLEAGVQKQIEVVHSDGSSNEPKDKIRKQLRARRASTGEGQKPKSGEYRPTFDASLDLKGLVEFYDQLRPANSAEKILVFAIFLKEKLGVDPCTADQIYTCFFTVKDRTKIPEAFVQAFHNMKARTHFIQFSSLNDIEVTIAGNNHFEEMKKRKAAE